MPSSGERNPEKDRIVEKKPVEKPNIARAIGDIAVKGAQKDKGKK